MCDYQYHVALSFAGEDRQIAQELWEALMEKGLRVFYDKEHLPRLWGAVSFIQRSALSAFC